MKKLTLKGLFAALAVVALLSMVAAPASAETATEIDHKVDEALAKLYASTPAAVELSKVAKGILVFPRIVKAGFVVGAKYGTGALRVNGQTEGYYRTMGASYGLQAGAQAFGYAMFFMTDDALNYLRKSKGWEVGVGPSIVVVDKGMARSLSTSSLKSDIYVFFFDQKGLMAGLGIQGTKISRFNPTP